MKITTEHYAQLSKVMTEFLNQNPAMAIEYQAMGLSPKRLRWDALRMSGMRIGDSVGMTRPENVEPSHFLPVYDYADDDHIDTALRAIFKQAGHEYGAFHKADEAPALVVGEGNCVTPAGNFLATLTYRDPRTDETATTNCVITSADGQIFAYSEIARLARQGDGAEVYVSDIEGHEYEVLLFDDQLVLGNPAIFAANQSIYRVTTYDRISRDNEDGEQHEDGRWEGEPFTLDEIRGEARNLGYSEFDGSSLYSTDPSGTREFYEQGINRFHHMRIDSINGMPPTLEQMKVLGDQLGLGMNAGLVPTKKPSMRMGM